MQGTIVARQGAPARVLPLLDLVRLARPQQWQKNLLLYAGFLFSAGAAWSWRDPDGWIPFYLSATAAVWLFNLLSSGGYLVNDALDAERDRAHPRERLRPVAARRCWPGSQARSRSRRR